PDACAAALVADRARDCDVGGCVLAPCEQVVLLAELQRANLALSFAVVELEAPIREAALEVLSLIGRVRRRLVQPRPGDELRLNLLDPSVELVEHWQRAFVADRLALLGGGVALLARPFDVVELAEVGQRDRGPRVSAIGGLLELSPDVHAASEAPLFRNERGLLARRAEQAADRAHSPSSPRSPAELSARTW